MIEKKEEQKKKKKLEEEQNSGEEVEGREEGEFSADGSGFIDLEAVLQSSDNYSDAGRAKYIPADKIPVGEFDPLEMPPDCTFLLYGSRRTGKSTFFRYWAYSWRHWFHQVYVFTRTKRSGFWQQMIPNMAVYQDYDEQRLEDIIQDQEDFADNPEEFSEMGPNTAIWFDDVVSDRLLREAGTDGNLARLYVEGRHIGERIDSGDKESGVQAGLATQMITAMPPKIRKNLDFAVVMKQVSDTDKERLWTEYMGRLNKRTAFELIEKYTQVRNPKTPQEERDCFIIVTDPALSYNDRFFKCTTPQIEEKFKLGTVAFWKAMQEDDDGKMKF